MLFRSWKSDMRKKQRKPWGPMEGGSIRRTVPRAENQPSGEGPDSYRKGFLQTKSMNSYVFACVEKAVRQAESS